MRLLVTDAQRGRTVGLDEVLILNVLWWERGLVTSNAARLAQKPEAESCAALHRLVEAGFVEERGSQKGRSWHLSPAAYRSLGDKAGYVHRRGFEPLQQEQMILQYACCIPLYFTRDFPALMQRIQVMGAGVGGSCCKICIYCGQRKDLRTRRRPDRRITQGTE